jgi:type IV secretion system protein TrbL
VAQVGLDAGRPLLDLHLGSDGLCRFFENFIQIAVLLLAWVLVLIAFFMLAIQLFVTLIEFKLSTLCGFVLIPFGLFGKTAFMAERVLGNVISSGIKVLVLAVIIGIGSTLFASSPPDLAALSRLSRTPWRSCWRHSRCWALASSVPASPTALSLAARSLAQAPLLEPHLPQAVRLSAALRGQGLLQVRQAVRSLALPVPARAPPAGRCGLCLGSAGKSGAGRCGSGLGGVAQAAAGAAMTSPLREGGSLAQAAFREGGAICRHRDRRDDQRRCACRRRRASGPSAPPAWAANMKNRQSLSHGATVAAHTLRSGDGGGGGTSIDVSEKD